MAPGNRHLPSPGMDKGATLKTDMLVTVPASSQLSAGPLTLVVLSHPSTPTAHTQDSRTHSPTTTTSAP